MRNIIEGYRVLFQYPRISELLEEGYGVLPKKVDISCCLQQTHRKQFDA